MRQSHRAGEKMFVDYAGHTVGVVERDTGEVRETQISIAVLGASNYTFAEATWTQGLSDWCASHERTLRLFGGVPEITVPDDLRSAVTKAHRYEPDLNSTYADFAAHYGFAIIPARVRRPRGKAKAEAGVLLVERWILAALRNRLFFSLAEQDQSAGIEALSFMERLGLLVDREMTYRDNRRMTSRLRRAKLRHNTCIEDINYRHPRGLDRALIHSLANCRWLTERLNECCICACQDCCKTSPYRAATDAIRS